MQPFDLLISIAQRSKHNAAQLPQQVESTTYWRGVGFFLAGQRLVVEMNDVREILQPPKLTKVPGVRSWVLGVANVRGRLVPIMDLAGLVGMPTRANWRSRRVLIVEKENYLCGLLVDAVLGMQQFSAESQSSESDLASELSKFSTYSYEKDNQIWSVFEIDKLIAAPEFLQVAV